MDTLQISFLENWYTSNFENRIKGRRILFEDIEPLIKELPSIFKKEVLGYSENKIPIYKVSIGKGPNKILLWSQMHGNESTGTKALFDLFNFFISEDIQAESISRTILENCTLEFIVLLNPDGAIKFTRENANNIDLNRDAVNRVAIESNLLRDTLDSFNPKFCFNLHDQRSIFNVKETSNPATISFLAPSVDIERTLNKGRIETMSIIVKMNNLLQQIIPNHIGRYTDEFYPTATGDNFQKLGHNTILIEAGQFKDDYDREVTRKYNFYAILQGLYSIATNLNYKNHEPYFEIPNNDNKFLDIIYKNVIVNNNNENSTQDVGIQLKFKVIDNKLVSYEAIEQKGNLTNYHTFYRINKENTKINELKLSNS